MLQEEHLAFIVERMRDRAPRSGLNLMLSPQADSFLAGLDELLAHNRRSYQLLDGVFATAWEGMREIVEHEFGREEADGLSLKQQRRFREGLLLVLNGLFPDYGDPAAFKEHRPASKDVNHG